MTEFTTDVEMEPSVPSGAGRALKRELENAIEPLTIEAQIEQNGGGSPAQQAVNGGGGGGRMRSRSRREHRWKRQNNGFLESIADTLEGAEFGEDGGGGGLLGGLGGVALGGGGLLTTGLLGAGGAIGGMGEWDMLTESPFGTDMIESFGEGDITGALSDIDVSSIFADQLGSGVVSGTALDQGLEMGGDWASENINFEWPSAPDWADPGGWSAPDWINPSEWSSPDWMDPSEWAAPDWLDPSEWSAPDWTDPSEWSAPGWADPSEWSVPTWLDPSEWTAPDWMDPSEWSAPDWLSVLLPGSGGGDGGGDGSGSEGGTGGGGGLVDTGFSVAEAARNPTQAGQWAAEETMDFFGVPTRGGNSSNPPPTPDNNSSTSQTTGNLTNDVTATFGDTVIEAPIDDLQRAFDDDRREREREIESLRQDFKQLERDIRRA